MTDVEYKTFSFVSGKGGVGKTLIAINAACELSANSDVLLIDFDLYNYGLTLWFKNVINTFGNKQSKPNILTLYDIMKQFELGKEDTEKSQYAEKIITKKELCMIQAKGASGKIHLLPCFVPLSEMQADFVAMMFREKTPWSKEKEFVKLLRTMIPLLVTQRTAESKNAYVLFDCHPGLVACSAASCAISDCNILISDFDDSTILASIAFLYRSWNF